MKKLLVVFLLAILGMGIIFITCDNGNDKNGGSNCYRDNDDLCIFASWRELRSCGKPGCLVNREKGIVGWPTTTYHCDC